MLLLVEGTLVCHGILLVVQYFMMEKLVGIRPSYFQPHFVFFLAAYYNSSLWAILRLIQIVVVAECWLYTVTLQIELF